MSGKIVGIFKFREVDSLSYLDKAVVGKNERNEEIDQ